eukprot:7386336-Prymnesium_polylepis.1
MTARSRPQTRFEIMLGIGRQKASGRVQQGAGAWQFGRAVTVEESTSDSKLAHRACVPGERSGATRRLHERHREHEHHQHPPHTA